MVSVAGEVLAHLDKSRELVSLDRACAGLSDCSKKITTQIVEKQSILQIKEKKALEYLEAICKKVVDVRDKIVSISEF